MEMRRNEEKITHPFQMDFSFILHSFVYEILHNNSKNANEKKIVKNP